MMPRKTPAPDEAPALPPPIHPTGCYDLAQARAVLGLTASTLQREVFLRRIRFARRAGRLLFMGSWLIQWLEDAAEGPGDVAGRPGGAAGDTSPSINGEQALR
jgi:hypothetical protein